MKSIREEALQFIIKNIHCPLDSIHSKIAFIDDLFFKQKIDKPEFKQIEWLGKTFPCYTIPETLLLLNLQEYATTVYFLHWRPSFELKRIQEGWKTHISIVTFKEYLFVIHYILPILRKYKIPHKIVRPDKMEEFNQHPIQKGKILTIYPESLDFLSIFKDSCVGFLLEDNDFRISTDLHLGGKVYVRYTGYSTDYVINPETNQPYYIERKEGFYKPEWIPDPPDLLTILKKEEITHV